MKRLNGEYDTRPICHHGRIVGVAVGEDERVVCRKKSFASEELADQSLDQISLWGGQNTKPIRAYQCVNCAYWHLTHWHTAPVAVDSGCDDDEN